MSVADSTPTSRPWPAAGARSIADAVFGPTTVGEIGYAHRLLPSLRHGMTVLLDRGLDAAASAAQKNASIRYCSDPVRCGQS